MDFEENFLDRFVAKKLSSQSPLREDLIAQLIRLSRRGHLCMPLPDEESIPDSLDGPIVVSNHRCYLRKNWIYETKIKESLARISCLKPPSFYQENHFTEALGKLEKVLQPEQTEAIRSVFHSSFRLICGGPGTGKTYTAANLIRCLAAASSDRLHVALAAPTGKAASHLEKSVGAVGASVKISASTLHRLLKQREKIDADLVIVDEGSMIDIALWVKLFEALRDETRLVVLGDPDQLPPVEAGSLFSDLSSRFGTRLKRCMRTEVSQLHALAEAIRLGDADQMQQSIGLLNPITTETFIPLFKRIAPWVGEEKPDPRLMFDKYRKLGIVNALRQGPLGVEAFHRQILSWTADLLRAEQWWAIPIQVTANEPRLELYNGTFGVLIGQGAARLLRMQGTAYFPSISGDFQSYPSPPPIECAFSLSVHKSQGSEFEEVIGLFPTGSERLGREALYTAATRAKKKLEVFGDEKTLREMVGSPSRRVSGFTIK